MSERCETNPFHDTTCCSPSWSPKGSAQALAVETLLDFDAHHFDEHTHLRKKVSFFSYMWMMWKKMSSLQQQLTAQHNLSLRVHIKCVCVNSWSEQFVLSVTLFSFSALYQIRQQAAAGGQPRPSLPNGELAGPSPHHAGFSRTSPLNHTATRPPCVTQPTANGSCSTSPSAGLPGHPDKNHNLGLGGGGASNGNVPYPQQNSLPHNCKAASQPSTSSTTSSPSQADETWRSQQRNTTTQVHCWLLWNGFVLHNSNSHSLATLMSTY